MAQDDSNEPCPFCHGKGSQVGTRGGQPGPRNGRTHGHESTYQKGCRCVLCTAHRQYAAIQRQRKLAAVSV